MLAKDGGVNPKITKAAFGTLEPTREALLQENARKIRAVEDEIAENEGELWTKITTSVCGRVKK